jgi:multidrug efflux pump subunit AcrA (membrane-fusion protein)
MKVKQIVIPVSILGTGFLLMLFLLNIKSDPPKSKPVARPKIVQAALIKLKDVKSEITAFGRLTSSQPIILYSEVAGILEKGNVNFQSAGSFRKGALLIKVDDRQVRLDLNSIKSDFLNALAAVLPEIKVDFPDEFEKYQNYFNSCDFESNLKPLPKTNNQKIKFFLTRFNVYKLFYNVKNLEIRLEKHYFYAPFNGSIVSADLHIGSSVRSGSKIGELINLEQLEVEIPVATQDIQWINHNKPVILTSSEIEGQWLGKIKRIGKSIDERTQTVPVFVSVKNKDNNLINGVFLKASIPGKIIENSISVPSRAIYNENFVYMVKNNKLDYKKIDVIRRQSDSVIVKGNIQNGDTLVTDLMQGVASGMPAIARISVHDQGEN